MKILPPRTIVEGEVRVNHGQLLHRHAGIVAYQFDLATKRAQVEGSGQDSREVPQLMLGAGRDTLHTDESKSGIGTVIEFPAHPGFRVFAAEVRRYTLNVCLVKP